MNKFSYQDENTSYIRPKPARSLSSSTYRQPLRALTPTLSISLQNQDNNSNENNDSHHQLGNYALEIYDNLFQSETEAVVNYNYLDLHIEINSKMRAILIDWIISAHLKFKLLPETLFIAVNLVDRYLEKKAVYKQHLQLVGLASLLIASKYEEIYPPETLNLVKIADNAYSKEQILLMESDILRTLDFKITVPSSWRFLERLSKITEMSPMEFAFARYLLELSLIEYHMLRYKLSLISASVVYLARKIFRIEPHWSKALGRQARVDESELKECARDLYVLLQGATLNPLEGIKEKFSRKDFMEVAKIRINVN
ncbi:unnamed protein product [Blepharisma stoltei]|uniref:Cyclin N-terminal domain-containing protein n=1 Tax=Blepharisma stoltei TaxID=1481888 RepID=A0AAU9JEM2_9CILI|nr:unnamed protein product [Blepharisma stoltei]